MERKEIEIVGFRDEHAARRRYGHERRCVEMMGVQLFCQRKVTALAQFSALHAIVTC